jgi:hypothetical protein
MNVWRERTSKTPGQGIDPVIWLTTKLFSYRIGFVGHIEVHLIPL